MNTPSTRNLINDYQVAAVADLDRLAARITRLRSLLQGRTLELGRLVDARDEAKSAWTAFALKSRQLEDAARRVAHQTLREAMATSDHKLADLIFEKQPDSVGNDVIVTNSNVDYVLAGIWRGLCRVLEVDPATAKPPTLRLPDTFEGWRVRGRWLPLISDADAAEAMRWVMRGPYPHELAR